MDKKPMDKNAVRLRSTLIAIAVAGSLLGACDKHHEPQPDNQQSENQQVETPAPALPTQPPAAEPPPKPKPVAPKVKAAPKPDADQQMLDDADATGMTSHTSPDADTSGSDTSGSAGNSQL